jgi:hypothetical protein
MAMIGRAIEERDWKDGIEVLSASSDWIAFRITPRRVSAERLVRYAAGSNTLDNPIGHIEYRETHGMRPGGFGIMMTKQLVIALFCNL